MTCSDSREVDALRADDIHGAPRRQMALERPGRFLFDLLPCLFGDGREVPMEIIHVVPLFCPFRIRYQANRHRSAHSAANRAPAAVLRRYRQPVAMPVPISSRNVAVGTKNSPPVTARLKSSRWS